MNTLDTDRVARTLARLYAQAEETDRPIMDGFNMADLDSEAFFAQIIADESNLQEHTASISGYFLAVTPEFGRHLYMIARMARARVIVEFGSSMGISTIHLAAALRDIGGGRLIGTEMQPGKAAKARAHLDEAGLSDLVEIRVGNALETLTDLDEPIDVVLLDGAWSLYLPVLKLLEPSLRPGAVIVAENAFEHAGGYLGYVRDPANGYITEPMPAAENRGNYLSIFAR